LDRCAPSRNMHAIAVPGILKTAEVLSAQPSRPWPASLSTPDESGLYVAPTHRQPEASKLIRLNPPDTPWTIAA
ncbi:MAG: hypothetical protein VW806_13435, partial [Halieaceae bacterium]